MFRNLMTTLACAVAFGTACAQSPSTPTTQMEMLTRGVVAVPNGSGNFVSWRLLGYYLPYYAASFTPDAIREATVQPIGASSSYFDLAGRNVGTDWNRLASGVYIIKGKKYVKR